MDVAKSLKETQGNYNSTKPFYCRFHNVTSGPIEPLWTPFSAVKVVEENLFFTLKLKTGKSRAIEIITTRQKKTDKLNEPHFTHG